MKCRLKEEHLQIKADIVALKDVCTEAIFCLLSCSDYLPYCKKCCHGCVSEEHEGEPNYSTYNWKIEMKIF